MRGLALPLAPLAVLLAAGGCNREPDFDQRFAARSARMEAEANAISRDIDLRLKAEAAAHPASAAPPP